MVPCAVCNTPRPSTARSLPPGELICNSCRKLRQKPRPALPNGWHCQVCGHWSERNGRPTGKYCADHQRNAKPAKCRNCGLGFITTTGRIYCSDSCKPKQIRKPRPAACNLDWKQCVCSRWVCTPGIKYCSTACAKEARALAAGHRYRQCRQCKAVLGYFSRKHLCDQCRLDNKRSNKQNDRERAKNYGVKYEPINRLKVYERDNWRCGICKQRIDKRIQYPHPMSASLDHVIPMSLGGGHLYSNVQCSHWICNVRKSNTGFGDQLALIG